MGARSWKYGASMSSGQLQSSLRLLLGREELVMRASERHDPSHLLAGRVVLDGDHVVRVLRLHDARPRSSASTAGHNGKELT